MAKYELGVIGGGNMAEAILRGALDSGFLTAASIIVSDPSPQRRQVLGEGLGVEVVDDNAAAACCPRILLAVKPQMMGQVLDAAAAQVGGAALVISIAAGITTALLDAKLGGRGRIIRTMPNTPMLVGCGMTALSAGPRATAADLEWAQGLFAASGKTCMVQEAQLDAVTAVSGSGPAYFFYLVEAMVEAGAAEGLDRATALALAAQTCIGAGRMLIQTAAQPQDLRAKVTSPNGTTQRAIESMERAGVKASLVAGVRSAAARSRELSGPAR